MVNEAERTGFRVVGDAVLYPGDVIAGTEDWVDEDL